MRKVEHSVKYFYTTGAFLYYISCCIYVNFSGDYEQHGESGIAVLVKIQNCLFVAL